MNWLLATILISAANLNSTIDKLPESGGIIELKREEITLSQPIIVNKNNVYINGNGAKLTLADNSNCPVIIVGDLNTPITKRISNVCIDNLIIDGNKDHQKYEGYGGECDTGGTTAIRNNGIDIRGCDDVFITNIESRNNRSGGIVTEKNSQHITIANCDLHDNKFDGLAGCETYHSIFINISSHNNEAAGFSCDMNFSENKFISCNFYKNKTYGLYIRFSDKNYFKNIIIKQNILSGIYINQVDEMPTTGACYNKLYDVQLINNGLPEIYLNNESCIGNIIAAYRSFP